MKTLAISSIVIVLVLGYIIGQSIIASIQVVMP